MKPPICSVCQQVDHRAELVKFTDYRPLPAGRVGHPHGLEWFCSRHADAAKALVHLPTEEALKLLRAQR